MNGLDEKADKEMQEASTDEADRTFKHDKISVFFPSAGLLHV